MVGVISAFNTTSNIEYDSLKSWIRLILLFTIGVMGTVGMWSVVVVMPAIENEFNIDRGQASLLYATTMVGFGLGNFLIGKIIDKFGLKLPIIFAIIILVSSYLIASGLSNSRMEAISYGEERPLILGSYESSWQKNRRVEIK